MMNNLFELPKRMYKFNSLFIIEKLCLSAGFKGIQL